MKVKLEHYSRKKRKSVDPKFMGTGYAGEECKRPERIPRSYWYIAGTEPEHWFRNQVKHTWEGKLSLYDIGTDVSYLYRNPHTYDWERALKNSGYDGYYHSKYYPEIVAIFKKLEIK